MEQVFIKKNQSLIKIFLIYIINQIYKVVYVQNVTYP